MTGFVDTNVFIRLLAADDPEKTKRCLALFKQAETGQVELATSESVIAEVVYVLSSRTLYNLPRRDIARLLRPILGLRGLKVEHKQSFFMALDQYEHSNLDFEDCLSLAHMRREGWQPLYSYDRDFDRFPSCHRAEP